MVFSSGTSGNEGLPRLFLFHFHLFPFLQTDFDFYSLQSSSAFCLMMKSYLLMLLCSWHCQVCSWHCLVCSWHCVVCSWHCLVCSWHYYQVCTDIVKCAVHIVKWTIFPWQNPTGQLWVFLNWKFVEASSFLTIDFTHDLLCVRLCTVCFMLHYDVFQLCRAVAVQRKMCSLLNGAETFRGEVIWSKQQIVKWCRQRLYTPLDSGTVYSNLLACVMLFDARQQ